MIAYRLESACNDNVKEEVKEFLYDIDDDFFTKAAYIKRAETITWAVNTKFNTKYKWTDLFNKPTDIGWRYCAKCNTFYWADDECDCYE